MQTKGNRLQLRLPVQDYIDLKCLVVKRRKDQSEYIAETLEEAMNGTLGSLQDEGFQATSATIDDDLIRRFKQFAKANEVPLNTMLVRALKAKLQKEQQ